jgi:hypothetical protein
LRIIVAGAAVGRARSALRAAAHRGWDHHGGPDGNLVFDLKKRCLETDQPCVALIKDLKGVACLTKRW